MTIYFLAVAMAYAMKFDVDAPFSGLTHSTIVAVVSVVVVPPKISESMAT